MSAKVSDAMTRNVVAVHENASFQEIAAELRDDRVSAFPVLDDSGTVIGVVSEGDLIAKEAFEGGYESHPTAPSGIIRHRGLEKAKGITAGELMSTPPVTVGPDDLLSHAAQLMYDRRVKRLPVVNDAGRPVGIISRTDVLSVFSRPDKDIGRQIHDLIGQDFLCDPASYRIDVQDGIVTLGGRPESAAVGREIVGAVRHIEGVVAVRDRLDYPTADPVRTYRAATDF